MEIQLQAWALKKKIRPVLLDTLAAMHVTCSMFLMHCFGFRSPIMISASKSRPLF